MQLLACRQKPLMPYFVLHDLLFVAGLQDVKLLLRVLQGYETCL